jgi:DNA-binding transcriptional LysR family regulator
LNLARFDLVSIKLIVLCVDCGSLSIAAKQAHMSLSSASHRLAKLEATIGASLFRRDHRGLRPTPAGALFAAHGRAILQSVDELGSQLTGIDKDT